jgi:hypothetical protein
MTEYDNTNTGKIWKNENPGRGPTYTIDVNFEGRDLRIAIWKRREDANPKAPPWSFKIEDKGEQSTGRHSYSPGGQVRREDPITSGGFGANPKRNADMDDDIPFAPEFR